MLLLSFLKCSFNCREHHKTKSSSLCVEEERQTSQRWISENLAKLNQLSAWPDEVSAKICFCVILVNRPFMTLFLCLTLPLLLFSPLSRLYSAVVDCASLPESSQCNGILHNTELVRICRSHICHHRMLITVNPFTSRKAGANTARAVEYLYPLVLKSGYVPYTAQITLCQLCLLTISHCELPSRLCGPTS